VLLSVNRRTLRRWSHTSWRSTLLRLKAWLTCRHSKLSGSGTTSAQNVLSWLTGRHYLTAHTCFSHAHFSQAPPTSYRPHPHHTDHTHCWSHPLFQSDRLLIKSLCSSAGIVLCSTNTKSGLAHVRPHPFCGPPKCFVELVRCCRHWLNFYVTFLWLSFWFSVLNFWYSARNMAYKNLPKQSLV